MTIDWAGIAALVVAVGGLIAALDARKSARQQLAEAKAIEAKAKETEAKAKKNTADAGESAAESVRLLLDPLNLRIESLQSQLTAFANREKQLQEEREARETAHKKELDGLRTIISVMQSEINEFRGGVDVLLAQMEAGGIVPRWKPKPKTGPLGKGG